MRYNFYFCNVKLTVRHDVAALVQRFLCHNLLVLKYKRKECGSSNARKDLAQLVLTARNALSLLSKNLSL